MNVAIIFNHPYEGSFCNAILGSVTTGLKKANHEIDLIHLDKEQFNPVMTANDLKGFRDKKAIDPKVLEYKGRIERADHLIFIFPIWWELMPAMTKGFVDKVIFPGIAYDYTNAGNTRMKPLWTKLKGVTMITTMNTPKFLYWGIFGYAIKKAMMLGTFWKIGYKNRKWITFNKVKQVSKEKREKWLAKIEDKFEMLDY
ncbi:Putative NADPH-quinone reductase (modulator of drug activity B) [Gillisia sp. Hel1_33_143]|uniref:NAD(P)H-dependent oxidoreductase n=1 Tax=Gillisia sp. Hel1_33_143 TaxID=1336796 RepID=UPI00087C95E7|nr:NAD(P)H-dependent oxidoreductase [Gillisia sp. Hel1_33_143]SDR99532.1 Putative NADPH-quinone reductase (modulator of drug activity B) [Gillisia sp. Hel1_33_143]